MEKLGIVIETFLFPVEPPRGVTGLPGTGATVASRGVAAVPRVRLLARRRYSVKCRRKQGFSAGSGIGSRSEEHTSELQSLMRNSYAVFCLKTKKHTQN